jgi:hypothetical protein
MVARTALSAREIPFLVQGFGPYGLLLEADKRTSSTLNHAEEETRQLSPPLCPVADLDMMPCLVPSAGFKPHMPQGANRTLRRQSLPDRYLEGWAEADPEKILMATARDFRFCDPLVGVFLWWNLHEYFALLQNGLAVAGASTPPNIAAFRLHQMDQPTRPGQLQFWRESPQSGLTGLSEIVLADRGIISENVSYDVNLASDMLRRAMHSGLHDSGDTGAMARKLVTA